MDTSYTVDLSTMINPYLEIILTALGSLVCILITVLVKKASVWLEKKTGTEVELTNELFNKLLHKTVEKGVQYAVQQSNNSDWTSVKTKNKIVADASTYVKDIAPSALEHFGYSPVELEKIITARIAVLDTEKSLPGASTVDTTSVPGETVTQ